MLTRVSPRLSELRDRFAWLFALAAALYFVWPIVLEPGLPRGDDALFHAQLAEGVRRGFLEGIAYPRWLLDANRGFGSPALLHYPPLGAFLAGALARAGLSIADALRASVVLSALASAVSFYLAARPLAAPALAALGAAFYALAPYHSIDLYNRFALAEYHAFAVLPWLIAALRRALRVPSLGASLGLALAFGTLVLTHVLIAYMAFLCLLPYALALAPRTGRAQRLFGLAAAGAFGLALAAVYLVPLLAEHAAIHAEFLTRAAFGSNERNFLFRDEVALGFKRSLVKPLLERAFLWQLAPACVALAFVRKRGSESTEGAVLFALFVATSVLQLPATAFAWRLVPGMTLIAFPWRFQLFQLAFGLLFTLWVLERNCGLLARASVCAAGAAMAFTGIDLPANPFVLDQAGLEQNEFAIAIAPEHIPSAVPDYRRYRDRNFALPTERVLAPAGVRARVLAWRSQERVVQLEVAPARARVVLRTFDYPGWRAELDGRAIAIRPEGPYRAIGVDVPRGRHRLRCWFGVTWDRAVGGALSIAAWLVLCGALALSVHRARSARARRAV